MKGHMKFRETSRRTERVWFAALVIYICLIYGHSMMPASVSSQESGFLLVKLCAGIEKLGFDSGWLTEHIIRKMAHFTEYAGLGCLLCLSGRTWLRGNGRTVLEMAFVIPFVDETHTAVCAGPVRADKRCVAGSVRCYMWSGRCHISDGTKGY